MHHEFARLLSGRWWIHPSYISTLQAQLQRAETMTEAEFIAAREAHASAQAPAPTILGDVALIEVCGPITYRSSWLSRCLGWAAIEDLQIQLRAAYADSSVRTILIRWDSPGGVVDMVKEFADELYTMRGKGDKAIISVADLMICSAAYWLASQTDTIYATDSSQIGSIGVYTMHVDFSGALEHGGVKVTFIHYGEHKVDGNAYAPLTDDVKAVIQAEVDEIGGWFDAACARGRGVTKKQVSDQFGQGLVFSGPRAIELGLADKRGTFQQVLGRLTKGRAVPAGRYASSVVGASDDEDPIEPDDDGECPDGYELDDDDGMCYLTAESKQARSELRAAAQAQADADAAAAAIAIHERG